MEKVENVFTGLLGVEILWFAHSWMRTTEGFFECAVAFGVCGMFICLAKVAGRNVGKPLSFSAGGTKRVKHKNVQKFADQFWQFALHLVFSVIGVITIQQTTWMEDSKTVWIPGPVPDLQRRFYVAQTVSYLILAVSHRFFEERHKDFLVMYLHHLVTSLLLLISWQTGNVAIGVLILAIHDISDLPLDLLKMTNYLGWDSDSGIPITEGFFVLNLFTWMYMRLWIFPTQLIRSAVFEAGANGKTCLPETDGIMTVFGPAGVSGLSMPCMTCRIMLCILWCMHVYWFLLILRIALKLITGKSGHEAGADEYEGDSD